MRIRKLVNRLDKYPGIVVALRHIDGLATNLTLTKWQRSCASQAAKYLRSMSLDRGANALHKTHLTSQEVAQRFEVSPVTIRLWAAAGAIDSISTPGGHRRFPVEAVERFARKYRYGDR